MSTESPSPKDQGPKKPFSEPDQTSDIVFIVEDKKIHFTKAFLIACSPVFERMFEADFAEKVASEIPLPDKKYEDIVEFFKHIHPMFATFSTVTDANLAALAVLSNEYQLDPVRERCRLYIWKEAGMRELKWAGFNKFGLQANGDLDTSRVMLFLYACEQHDFQDMLAVLKDIASKKKRQDIEKSEYRELLQDKTLLDIYRSLCERLDK